MGIKKALLGRIREKTIEHEIKLLEKNIMSAYRQNNYKEVERISNRILELRNKQLNNMNSKLEKENERQLDNAFAMIRDINQDLGLSFTPNQKRFIQEAMTSKPLTPEEDMQAERLLQEIMRQRNNR